MRFIAEDYGPQAHVDIELGDLVTLFIGSNNTGKSFASRAIYAILKSCRGGECNTSNLATLLLNSNMASERDLWFLSRDFCGRFSLTLEDKDLKFRTRIDYDKNRHEQLVTEILGEMKALSPLYVPAYRVASLGLPYILAGYVIELRDVMLRIASQIATAFGSTERKEIPTLKTSPTGFDSDLLHIFIRSLLSTLKPLLERGPDALKAITIALAPTLLDLAIAIHIVEEMNIDKRLKVMFKNLFPEFPYKALGFYHGERSEIPEIPLHLLSSGMMQTLPILCILNLALLHIKQGYERVLIFIDEPEINLEILRQTGFSEMLMDLIHSTYKEGEKISIVVATHSDFFAYSITRWLARNNLRNLAKVYEFKPGGVEEREIDEHGEVELETFSKAIRKVFFEEEFEEE